MIIIMRTYFYPSTFPLVLFSHFKLLNFFNNLKTRDSWIMTWLSGFYRFIFWTLSVTLMDSCCCCHEEETVINLNASSLNLQTKTHYHWHIYPKLINRKCELIYMIDIELVSYIFALRLLKQLLSNEPGAIQDYFGLIPRNKMKCLSFVISTRN